jgi:hypothetical protein
MKFRGGVAKIHLLRFGLGGGRATTTTSGGSCALRGDTSAYDEELSQVQALARSGEVLAIGGVSVTAGSLDGSHDVGLCVCV